MSGTAGDEFGKARSTLAILTIAHALGTLSLTIVMVLASAIQVDFSLNQTRFGILISAYYASQLLLAIPVGWLIDRVGVRLGLMLSHLLASCALFSLTIVDKLPEAAAALALLGASYSLLNPATSRGVLDYVPVHYRGLAMGIKQAGVPLGGLIAALIAIATLTTDWRTVVQWVAALDGSGSLVAFCLPRAASSHSLAAPRRFLADLRLLLSNRRLHTVGLVNGLYNVGQIGLWSYITLFFREVLQTSAPLASIGFGVVQIFSAVGRIGWGYASDRWFGGRRWPAALAIGASATTAFIILAMPISVGVALIIVAALGLTIGGCAGLMQVMAVEAVERRLAASAIGCNMLLVPSGAMIAPILFGAVVDQTGSFAIGWLLLAALVGAGAVTLLGAKDKGPQRLTS